MSLNPYDLNQLKAMNIPAESLADWGNMVMEKDLESAKAKMIGFYRKWGDRIFWAYKDQQMQSRYGKKLTDSEKAIHIRRMLASELFPRKS